MSDQLRSILDGAATSNRVRASAWDAFYGAQSAEDLQRRLDALPLPTETKASIFDAKFGQAPPALPAAATMGMLPQSKMGDAPPAPAPTLADRAVEALPMLGGMAGGVMGGIGGTVAGMGVGGVPGAVGGATLGGGAGEAARQLIRRTRGQAAPATMGEAAGDIALEGGIQGASEAVGAGLMKGAQMAGRGLMDFAIRPAPTVVEEFGDVATTALKERLPVGSVIPGMRKGSNIAQAKLREAGADTRQLLRDVGARWNVRFSAQDIARGPVSKLAGDIAKQPLSDSELAHVSRMFSEYAENHGTLTPERLKDLKQAAQRIAKPIFRAINQGNVPAASDKLMAQFNKAIAEGAQDALETIPGVAAKEGRTQALIGATKAIRRAEARRLPLAAEIAAPVAGASVGAYSGGKEGAVGGVGATMAIRAMLSPRSTSRAALMLTNEQIQQLLRQAPRGAVYAMLQELQDEQGDETEGQ